MSCKAHRYGEGEPVDFAEPFSRRSIWILEVVKKDKENKKYECRNKFSAVLLVVKNVDVDVDVDVNEDVG
jgi:hypothetical protein